MRATLVRIGIDQAYGGWNAPVDPATNEFVYVPIPEGAKAPQRPELATTYATTEKALQEFAAARPGVPGSLVALPAELARAATHLDPDFDQLTYGDNGERRGRAITAFGPGDLIVFYAGLRPVVPCTHRLVYALVGLYRVASIGRVADFPRSRWHENAHLRRLRVRPTDVVVHAEPGRSGRLRRCVPWASTAQARTAFGGTSWSLGVGSLAGTGSSSAARFRRGSSTRRDSWRGSRRSVRSWWDRTRELGHDALHPRATQYMRYLTSEISPSARRTRC